jgi:hypothetical protein
VHAPDEAAGAGVVGQFVHCSIGGFDQDIESANLIRRAQLERSQFAAGEATEAP